MIWLKMSVDAIADMEMVENIYQNANKIWKWEQHFFSCLKKFEKINCVNLPKVARAHDVWRSRANETPRAPKGQTGQYNAKKQNALRCPESQNKLPNSHQNDGKCAQQWPSDTALSKAVL